MSPERSPGGYSGTPLAKKIGVREGDLVALVGAPADFAIPEPPPGVAFAAEPTVDADVTIAFIRAEAILLESADRLAASTRRGAMLWIAWPRRAAGHESDVTERAVRDRMLQTGLVDVKVAALGEDWSGLKFLWRRQPAAG